MRRQSFADWELLVIDDGSEDASVEIASRMAEQDSRICVYAKKHGGVARMRNCGLEHASGDVIAFIDGDDLWAPYYLEYLTDLMERSGAGISSGKIVRFPDGEEEMLLGTLSERYGARMPLRKSDAVRERVITPSEAVAESLYQQGVEASMCGKLFKRDVLEGFRFREGELYEDLNAFYKVALGCGSFAESSLPVYLYRQRKGSIVHTFRKERLVVLDVTRRICDYMKLNHPELLAAADDRRFSANFNMLGLILKYEKESGDDRDFYKEKERECRAFIRGHARRTLKDQRVRLKNRLGALAMLFLPRRIMDMLLRRFS